MRPSNAQISQEEIDVKDSYGRKKSLRPNVAQISKEGINVESLYGSKASLRPRHTNSVQVKLMWKVCTRTRQACDPFTTAFSTSVFLPASL